MPLPNPQRIARGCVPFARQKFPPQPVVWALLLMLLATLACSRPTAAGASLVRVTQMGGAGISGGATPGVPLLQGGAFVSAGKLTPTPDPTRTFQVAVPGSKPQESAAKIIPDSELVYSPSTIGFDVAGTVNQFGGYLSTFSETDRQGTLRSGAEVVEIVAQRYSVNPRLLLALLEYQSGWVRSANPAQASLTFPMGMERGGKEGLLRQLNWAADQLNRGFYGWLGGSLEAVSLADGSSQLIEPGMNAGTVGLQLFFGELLDERAWQATLLPPGFARTYREMFGDPFASAFDPLVPANLQQPPLTWMWDTRETWYFTGGPHGGWDAGSAWAAVDFAPPNEQQGCAIAQAWVTAGAAGVIVRAEDGAVTQDLDGDGFEQTGWTLLYMHMDSDGRVAAGQVLPAGGRIGHPSCEGGYSNASHLHFARRYNGVWIAADNFTAPLNLAGWTARAAAREYDGWLVKGDRQLEAWDGYQDINALTMLQN